MDLVHMITPGQADIERYIKMAVGLAGIYHAYQLYNQLAAEAEAEPTAFKTKWQGGYLYAALKAWGKLLFGIKACMLFSSATAA